jgi:hypothetical protein
VKVGMISMDSNPPKFPKKIKKRWTSQDMSSFSRIDGG